MIGLAAAIAAQYGEQSKRSNRLDKFAGVKSHDSDEDKDEDGKASSFRKKQIQNKVKELEDKKNATANKNSLKNLLLQAGHNISPAKFYLFSFLFGLTMFGLAVLWKGFGIFSILVFFAMTIWYPKRRIKKKAIKRQKKFVTLFADAIDVIVRGIRSGLPVGECMQMIGSEMPDPVGHEFRIIIEGQKLGMPFDEIMMKSLERMPVESLKFFAIVLSIQQQTGGNLAETLSKLSDVLRQRKKMKDKVQALSSEAKASAMIIGSLPFILAGILSLLAPEYIGLLFSEFLGNVMIAGGLTWMGIGCLVMKKMISFDF
ncbi:MAG: type II secretion system F family protein [Alphaproteobacteria bacterium]|nr:type II secretion system F family protein [Alphaproteobacteria bacterium]